MANAFLNLEDIDSSIGFKINGVTPYDTSGYSVSNAGDINGDGIEDAIIGAPVFNGNNPNAPNTPGNVYVVFGNINGFPDELDLSALDGTNGFAIEGISANDLTGFSVSGDGDVNNDGFADVIIGARGADPNGLDKAGAAYVVFGKAAFDPTINLSDLNGDNGITINGLAEGDETGNSVSGIGDINGDGIDDVGIGALYADPNGLANAGAAYVVFGKQDGFSPDFDLNTLDGTNGFTFNGIAAGNETGSSVSGIGDFNGDGIGDLAITAPFADPNGNINAGSTYVIFGSLAGFSSNFDLNTLDGTNGFVINGEAAGDLLGESLSGAGDVNGDGFQDIIVGALGANGFTGTSYVIFGSDQPFSANFDLSQLNGTNGFAIEGINPGDVSGFSVSSAGDFDGDGFGELLVAAPGANTAAGETYLIFGKEGGFDASINLSELDGTNGFALKGVNAYDFSGISVSATDINGDGLSDLMFGASYGDPKDKTNAGETYVLYGRKPISGGAGKDSLDGTDSGDTIFGRDGNDTLFGNEGVNTMYGEDGNDVLYGGSKADYMYGGKGNDDLYGAGGNNKLFGGDGTDTIYSGSGDDFIDGGSGIDSILLGGGNDIVVLGSGNGADRIKNFQRGQTKFGLSGGLQFEDLNIVSRGSSTLIEVAATDQVLARIDNNVVIIIVAADFVSV